MVTKRGLSVPRSTQPPSHDRRPKNRLLAALPAADFERIRPHLETIPLSAKQILVRRGERMRYVIFPNGGVCSVTATLRDGTSVEVATVGYEGFVGATAFLGGDRMPGDCMVQVPVPDANAERLPVEAFRRELALRGALHAAVGRYMEGTFALMTQSTACVALHQVHQRCCRWLLMTHDRVKSDQFTLSHEFLAMMLGSTRPTVTAVARSLQDAGLIRYTHARMSILDRRGLEAASCECYATVKAEFDRLGL